jgi:hypothetical protein
MNACNSREPEITARNDRKLTTARTQRGHVTEGTPTTAGTLATAGKPVAVGTLYRARTSSRIAETKHRQGHQKHGRQILDLAGTPTTQQAGAGKIAWISTEVWLQQHLEP